MEQHIKQPQKEFLTTALLSLFVGWLGVDRFYIGKIGTGILKLITFGGFGVWYLIDLILIFTGAMRSKDGRQLAGREKHLKTALIVASGLFLLGIGIGIGSAGSATQSSLLTTVNKNQQHTEQPVAKPEPEKPKEPSVPAEYVSALSQATSYANTMYMSKQGVYDQLVSEYGGQFKTAAAKYAIEHVKADWKANALAKAKEYQSSQSLSPAAIHDQLTSAYGEKFTQAQADYAIVHLND